MRAALCCTALHCTATGHNQYRHPIQQRAMRPRVHMMTMVKVKVNCMCTWRYRYPANLGTMKNNNKNGGATITQQ